MMEVVIVLKNRDKFLMILLIFLIVMFLLIILLKKFVNYNEKEENNVINEEKNEIIEVSNEEVIKDREVSGILFSDIRYIYNGKETIITMDITNKNLETIEILKFEFIVYDKNNNLLGNFSGFYNKKIVNNEKLNNLLVGTDRDLSDVYSMDIFISKLEFSEEEKNKEEKE